MDENNLIQLARSLDQTPGTLLLADARGCITYCNEKFRALTGYKKEELVGMPMTSLWDQPSQTTQLMMAKLYSEQLWQGELRNKTKTGQMFWELISLSVILDGEGLITGFLQLGQEIQKPGEQATTRLSGEKGAKEILDLMNAGYVDTDLRGIITYANEGAAAIYHRTVRELLNLNLRDYLIREDAERLEKLINDIYREGGSRSETVQYDVIGKDGVIISCEAAITMIKNADGQPAGYAFIVRDVTETNKMEIALRESEKSYRQLVNMAPYSITISRADNRCYVLVNNAFVQRTGYTREEALGHTPSNLGLYVDEEDYKRLVTEYRTHGRIDDLEFRFRMKSGEITEVLLSGRPIIFQGIPCNLFMSTNIDAIKKAQRELMESEESANAIIESSPYSIIITRVSDLTYVHVNEAFCRRTGYSREETKGKTALDLNMYSNVPQLEQLVQTLIRDRKVPGQEIQIRAKDGRILETLMSVTPIRFRGESCLLTISADLGELKRTERELEKYRLHLEEMVKERTRALEEAQNELVKREKLSVLGQLTATVSHELRNPLGVIRTSAFYVQKKLKTADEKIQKHLNRIEEQVRVCDGIVDDLLEFTRGRNASMVTEDPTPWIREVIERVQDVQSIHIIRKFQGKLPPVPHDPEKIRRAIINILDNAVQAVRERQRAGRPGDESYEPSIAVSMEASNGEIKIVITDNGLGMDPRTLSQAFEPLFTTRSRGTGIGLANVKKIIEEHRGKAILESEPGQGTKVILLLPCSSETKTSE